MSCAERGWAGWRGAGWTVWSAVLTGEASGDDTKEKLECTNLPIAILSVGVLVVAPDYVAYVLRSGVTRTRANIVRTGLGQVSSDAGTGLGVNAVNPNGMEHDRSNENRKARVGV